MAQGAQPGLVLLLAQGDEDHVDAIGSLTMNGTEPMRRDTIVRIAAMMKPITAATTMLLVEGGILALDEPVERWLPELGTGGCSGGSTARLRRRYPPTGRSPCVIC